MWNKKSARRGAFISAYITTNIWPQAVQVTVFYKTTPNKIDQMNSLITHIDSLKQDCTNSSALAIDIIAMINPNTKSYAYLEEQTRKPKYRHFDDIFVSGNDFFIKPVNKHSP